MKTSLYETVKTFELRTDLATKLVSEVSARDNGRRPQYRIATFRVYDGPDGKERRSPWLGEREMVLKQGLEKAALDWPEFVALARASRLAPLVASTLRQATALFDSPVPADVLAELERAAASPLARLLSGTSVDGKESLAALLALPGWRARLRYASAVLFPSPRFMTLEYGLTRRGQLGAAYVRRAGYFTWQGLKGMVRLCS